MPTATLTSGATGGAPAGASPPDQARPFRRWGLHGASLLMVASSGGHATQLQLVASELAPSADSLFVTFPGVQARDIARTYEVLEVPYVAPRDVRAAAAALAPLRERVDVQRFDAALSTGAAIAVPALGLARSRGLRALYLESYTRFHEPSLTGAVLSRSRVAETYYQHTGWQRPWKNVGSVLDVLRPAAARATVPAHARRIFVTLGTIRPFRFDTLVDRMLELAPTGVEFVWQLGVTTRDDLPGEVHESMSGAEFAAAVQWADAVVSHGGTGTVLTMLQLGSRPILVPRRSVRGEHVDDHQATVCGDFDRRGLAVTREVGDLTAADLGWAEVAA